MALEFLKGFREFFVAKSNIQLFYERVEKENKAYRRLKSF